MNQMYELEVEATTDNLSTVISFLDDILEKHDVPMKTGLQLDVAVEEIYVNIASYAYAEGTGMAQIEMNIGDNEIVIRFSDQGQPYDPTKKPDPNLTLSLNERPIGGLGVYMVKESMDDMTYEYKNGSNVLTIRKSWSA